MRADKVETHVRPLRESPIRGGVVQENATRQASLARRVVVNPDVVRREVANTRGILEVCNRKTLTRSTARRESADRCLPRWQNRLR